MGAMSTIAQINAPILLPPGYPTVYHTVYHTINDVPIPLQHALKTAYDSGLTIKNIATVYDLPEDWLTLFVKPHLGRA